MKHSKFRQIIIFVLLMLLLISCNAPADGGDHTYETASGTGAGTDIVTEGADSAPFVPMQSEYAVTDLKDYLPYVKYNSIYAVSYIDSYFREDALYLYTQTPEPRILSVNRDGVCDEENAIPVPRVKEIVPCYAQKLERGGFCVLYQLENILMVAVTDDDGTVLGEASCHPEGAITSNAHTRPDNYGFLVSEEDGDVLILMVYDNLDRYFRFDADTGTLDRVAVEPQMSMRDSVRNAQYLGNDRFFLPVYTSSAERTAIDYYCVWDASTDTVTEHKLRLSEPEIDANTRYQYGADGKLYFYDKTGIWQYRENLPAIQVVEFSKCGLNFDADSVCIRIFDEQHVLISWADGIGTYRTQSFYHIGVERVPALTRRTNLTIHFYGNTATGTYDWMMDTVAAFQVAHPEYDLTIEATEPGILSSNDLAQKIGDALVLEEHPDIILTDAMNLSLPTLYDKGVFLDLREVFGDTLLGCVEESALWGDTLYKIPLRMFFQTFLSAEGVVDGTLTWESFTALMDGLGEDEVLTSDKSIYNFIYRNGIMDFFDKAAGSASYDSEEFCDMIRAVSEMNRYVDENVGVLASQGYSEDGATDIGYTNATLPARLRDGGIKLLSVTLRHTRQILALSQMMGETAINWCGLPSGDGGGAYITTLADAFILSDTASRDAAVEFLAYLLSDEVQNSDRVTDRLPVTKSAMRAALEAERFFYYNEFMYEDINNPNAKQEAGIIKEEASDGYITTKYKIISLMPEEVSSVSVADPKEVFGERGMLDENGSIVWYDYLEVEISQDYIDSFMNFLDNCHMTANADAKVLEIVEEELSYWENGIGTLEDAAQKIQSRVQIYLNE